MNNLLDKASAIWSKEEIKVQVMLSLTLQIVLIFFAPVRMRSCQKRHHLLIWLAYLGADYVATLALGSILTNSFGSSGADLPGQRLIAFWSPFLLLHLGGPDNITSYSIEDNDLWWRHLLSFVGQVSVAFVVLVQSTLQTTRLLVPIILVFIVGATKFGERTLALRSASMEQLKHSAQSADPMIVSNTDGDSEAGLVDVKLDAQLNGEVSHILRAYICFMVFKPHIVGQIISISQTLHDMGIRKVDRNFKFIGVELSFLYDIIHTKAAVIHNIAFRFIRIGSFVLIVIALVLFHISDKGDNNTSDLILTYVLFSVALFLEIYSALRLVASNWMVVSLLMLNKKWSINLAGFISRAKTFILWRGKGRQWSGLMGQYNLIQIATKGDHKSNLFKMASQIFFRGEKGAEVSDDLENMILKYVGKLFERIFSYNDFYDVVAKIWSSNWISNTLDQYHLREMVDEMKAKRFEECVIAWHVITDLYYSAANEQRNDDDSKMRESVHRISNYMMYLLLEKPSMMPPGIAKIKTQGTMDSSHILVHNNPKNIINDLMDRDLMYEIHNNHGQSVLPFAGLLVGKLDAIGDERVRWTVIGDVWLGMMTYAALHCSSAEHIRTVSMGGELLTFYWLLLAHYGVVELYNIDIKFWFYTMIRQNDVTL